MISADNPQIKIVAIASSSSNPPSIPIADQALSEVFWKNVAVLARDREITFQNTSELSEKLLERVFTAVTDTLGRKSKGASIPSYESFRSRFSEEFFSYINPPQTVTLSSDESSGESEETIDGSEFEPVNKKTPKSRWSEEETRLLPEIFSTAIKQIVVKPNASSEVLPNGLAKAAYSAFRKKHRDPIRSLDTFTLNFRPIALKLWQDHLNSAEMSMLGRKKRPRGTMLSKRDLNNLDWKKKETKMFSDVFSMLTKEIETMDGYERLILENPNALFNELLSGAWLKFLVIAQARPIDSFTNRLPKNSKDFSEKFIPAALPLWQDYVAKKQASMPNETSSFHSSSSETDATEWDWDKDLQTINELQELLKTAGPDYAIEVQAND